MASPVSRGDIQGLRAVAVGTVVLSHAGVPWFGGGYVGVDVFFVISGFLITGILTRGIARDGQVSLLDFYARRARRILPAAAVTLVGITIASWFAFGYIRLSQVLHDVVWAAFFGANVDAARSGTDYFAADGFVSPVQHFWSLSVEEQFYVLWPLLIAGVVLLARRHGDRSPLRAVGLSLVAVCAASLAWSIHHSTTDPTAAYFSTFTRAWELGAGALLAIVARHLRQFTRGFLALLSWTGLAMIAWACVSYSSATVFPGRAALVPVIGAVLVLAGGVRGTPYGASWLLDRGPMRSLGNISYSLYLVHWPLLMIPAMAAGHDLTPTRRAALVALAVTLAAISYRWVETPFRSAGFWQRGRARALALWPAAVAFVLVGVTVVGTQIGSSTATASRPEIDPGQPAAATSDTSSTAPPTATVEASEAAGVQLAVTRAASRSSARTRLPSRLTPSPLALRNANWRLPDHCWASTTAVRHDVCSMGDTSATRTLALFGDSHIGMWSAPIVSLAARTGWKVVVFLKTGCPPVDTPMWRSDGSRRFRECDAWRTWAYARMAQLHPARILVAGYTQSAIADPKTGDELRGDGGAAGTRALAQGMRSSLATLTAITPAVTVLADTTTLPEATADCLGQKGATLQTCAVPLNPTTAARNAAWKAAAAATGATWVDTTAWLCPKNICPLVVGNVVVYTDRHHLTRTFAQSLSPLLATALKL